MDGGPVEPQAPPYVVYSLSTSVRSDKVVGPIITITEDGTSFVAATERRPQLHTPPEDIFGEPASLASDIWTLGVSLYEVLGERVLFESLFCDNNDILADMVSTLGKLPTRWWDAWQARGDFFNADGTWVSQSQVKRIRTAVSRPLHQRMWHMGRGETPNTYEWDVEGGEVRALEGLLRAMLAFEPSKRPAAVWL